MRLKVLMALVVRPGPVMPMRMRWVQRHQMDVAVPHTASRDELSAASHQVRCLAARNDGVDAIPMIQKDALARDDEVVVVVLPLDHPRRNGGLASIVDVRKRRDAPLGLIRVEQVGSQLLTNQVTHGLRTTQIALLKDP